MNKEDNRKEKFKQALLSTYRVISDDYKVDRNKKKEEKIYRVGEIDNITDKNQFKKLRAETDSDALKKRFSDKKLLAKNNPKNPSCRTLKIAKQTSSPMKSASCRGPIGCAIPNFMTVSISSTPATPS